MKNVKKQTKNVKFTGKLKIYMQWPLWMTILLILGTVAMFTISAKAGVLAAVITVFYGLVAWLLSAGSQKDVIAELVTFAAHYGQVQKKLLKTFHIPYAIMDENGRLIWMNEAFMEVTGKTKEFHKSITGIFPQITKESFSGEDEDTILEYHVHHEERFFRAQLQQICFDSLVKNKELEGIEEYTQHLMAVYLFDETELNRYIKENKEQRFVAGLIYIDNYDEALESVE